MGDSEGKPAEFIVETMGKITKLFDEREARIVSDPDFAARARAAEEDRARREQTEQAREAQRQAYEDRSALIACGVPAKDVERILSGLLQETRALREARTFLDDLDARILVLAGNRGCGKTTAASWVVSQDCPDPYRGPVDRSRDFDWRAPRWPAELRPRFVDVSRFSRSSRYDDEQMGPLERCSMLAIDDLGMEYADAKGSFLSLLDGLVNARYAASLRTVITTNLGAGAFRERYGERVADRIREVGRYVEIADPSMRGRT